MDRRDYYARYQDESVFDKQKMTKTYVLENEDGEEKEYSFPAVMKVCGTCEGKGTHVNPSIDAHGITAEEWDRDWSYEDRDNYMNGFYDVTCYECGGNNVVPKVRWPENMDFVPEHEREKWKLLKQYFKNQDDRYAEDVYWSRLEGGY